MNSTADKFIIEVVSCYLGLSLAKDAKRRGWRNVGGGGEFVARKGIDGIGEEG